MSLNTELPAARGPPAAAGLRGRLRGSAPASTAGLASTPAEVDGVEPGTPLATFIIGWFGDRAILAAIAAVAVLTIATTAISIPTAAPVARLGIMLITAAFVLRLAIRLGELEGLTLTL